MPKSMSTMTSFAALKNPCCSTVQNVCRRGHELSRTESSSVSPVERENRSVHGRSPFTIHEMQPTFSHLNEPWSYGRQLGSYSDFPSVGLKHSILSATNGWVEAIAASPKACELRFVLSQVPKCEESPPQRRGPIRGDPDLGHPRIMVRRVTSVALIGGRLALRRRFQGSENSDQRAGIREQKSGIARFTLDMYRKSTTIWLWIDWAQHSRLCLIRPGGR